MPHISTYKELRVYQAAINAAVRVFELTKCFPAEERHSMTDQIRRSSRSVCANLGEAWRRRRYKGHFISKINECESEAEETRVWLELAWRCGYISQEHALKLDRDYDQIIGQLVRMVDSATKWGSFQLFKATSLSNDGSDVRGRVTDPINSVLRDSAISRKRVSPSPNPSISPSPRLSTARELD